MTLSFQLIYFNFIFNNGFFFIVRPVQFNFLSYGLFLKRPLTLNMTDRHCPETTEICKDRKMVTYRFMHVVYLHKNGKLTTLDQCCKDENFKVMQ